MKRRMLTRIGALAVRQPMVTAFIPANWFVQRVLSAIRFSPSQHTSPAFILKPIHLYVSYKTCMRLKRIASTTQPRFAVRVISLHQ